MAIIVDNINYIYGQGTAYEKHALKSINLEIPDGQFIGLIGHTGSGKSTLTQHLNGLIRATDGNIYYNGKDIYAEDFQMKDLRSKVGLVFQYPEHQLFETTIIKDVQFGPRNLGLPELEVSLRAFEALKLTGIGDDLLDASPFELSGGQKRRVAIAGVLAMKPEVLILDEPTAGLDPKGRDEILDQIAKIHKESGITVILVSHSMEDVARYADRIIVMNEGEVAFDAPPKEVFRHYRELEEIGLAAPGVTYLMNDLKAEGFEVDIDATTIEEACDSIIKACKSFEGTEYVSRFPKNNNIENSRQDEKSLQRNRSLQNNNKENGQQDEKSQQCTRSLKNDNKEKGQTDEKSLNRNRLRENDKEGKVTDK